MLVVRIERGAFVDPVESDKHSAGAAAEAQRHDHGRPGAARDRLDPMPHARAQIADVLTGAGRGHGAGQRAVHRQLGSDQLAASLTGGGGHPEPVAVLEQHEERARLAHSAPALDDQLEHALQIGLEADRPRDRRGRLEPSNGSLQIRAAARDVLVQARVVDRDRGPLGQARPRAARRSP